MRASEFEFRHRSWIVLLIFFLAFGVYAFEQVNAVEWLLGRSGLGERIFPTGAEAHAVFALGAAVIGVAAFIRTWSTAYLKTEVVRDSRVRAERLVADGPYRYVRNPLYFGNMLLAVGLAPMASPIGGALLVLGMELFLLRLIGREEAFLLEKQGEAYRAYLASVPRIWPSLRPRLPDGGTEPRWAQAWIGEIGMWAVAVGSAYFAFTFDIRVFDIVIIGGFILSRVLQAWRKRRLVGRMV